jgi:hypothetical protein
MHLERLKIYIYRERKHTHTNEQNRWIDRIKRRQKK